jgi:hypothetical protein
MDSVRCNLPWLSRLMLGLLALPKAERAAACSAKKPSVALGKAGEVENAALWMRDARI